MLLLRLSVDFKFNVESSDKKIGSQKAVKEKATHKGGLKTGRNCWQ